MDKNDFTLRDLFIGFLVAIATYVLFNIIELFSTANSLVSALFLLASCITGSAVWIGLCIRAKDSK